MPNDYFKEFIIQVLVHLDILVEPKHYRQEQESTYHSYIVHSFDLSIQKIAACWYKQIPPDFVFCKGQRFNAAPINLKDKAAGMDDFRSV
jgi:hypothetical protein